MLKFNTRLADIFIPILKYGICYFDLGNDAPPVDPRIGAAADANAAIGREVWDTTRRELDRTAPMRAEAEQIALGQARAAAATADDQRMRDKETYGYTKDTFRPLEQKIATDAMGYDTQARREQKAGLAMANVGSAIDSQNQQQMRNLASMGVDPSSNASLALARRSAVVGGAMQAAAGNQARDNVEAIGSAKLADAAALGRGISAGNTTQTQLGLQAGNAATGNAGAMGGITAQGMGMMNQGASTGISGNSSAGNLALGGYNAQLQADKQNQFDLTGLANLGSMAAGIPPMFKK